MSPDRERIGIALGGGGARGLAHIPVLEALDDLGIVPAHIAGTSMGAIIGALYAAGLPASEIRTDALRLTTKPIARLREVMGTRSPFEALKLLDRSVSSPGLLRGANVLSVLYKELPANDFNELKIPLTVIATDFWERKEVIFDSGPLVPAVTASMALPVLFAPEAQGGRILIDGGVVNPVPYDRLQGCTLTVGIDVLGSRVAQKRLMPTTLDLIFSSFSIMEKSILEEKLKVAPPDILIRPPMRDVRMLDFHRARDILEAAEPAKDELKRALEKALG